MKIIIEHNRTAKVSTKPGAISIDSGNLLAEQIGINFYHTDRDGHVVKQTLNFYPDGKIYIVAKERISK